MKLCVDCKWFSPDEDGHTCCAPRNDYGVSRVTGERYRYVVSCARHRSMSWPEAWAGNYCGKYGWWFERKDRK